jgi:hypothetical protein
LILVGLVALLGMAIPSDAPTKAKRNQCTPRGSVTVLQTTEAVRISRRGRFVYGCDRRTKRIMRLGPTGPNYPGKVILQMDVKRYFVAYVLHAVPYGREPSGEADVRWVDLRHRKRLNPPTGCAHRYEVSDGNGVVRIVLSSNGAIAWQCSDVAVSEIHKVDSAGPSLLDTSLSKGPFGDMQLDLGEYLGVTVYWVNLDGLHMSRLVGPARLP